MVSRARWLGDLLVLGTIASFLASGTGWAISQAFEPEPEDVVASLIPPPRQEHHEPVARHRDADDICDNNVFDFTRRPCIEPEAPREEEEDTEVAEPDIPPLCEGSAELVGTVASKRSDWSFAMIEVEGETRPYRVGDEVEELGEVEQIGWRLVLVDRSSDTDCLLDVFAEQEEPQRRGRRNRARRGNSRSNRRRARRAKRRARRQKLNKNIDVVSSTERNVSRSFVDELTENPTNLMRSVRVRPYSRDGQVQGFKLYRIRRNTLLSRLGFRNGDLIKSINGIEITSADRALAAYTKLRRTDSLAVTINRRGRPMSLDFNIR